MTFKSYDFHGMCKIVNPAKIQYIMQIQDLLDNRVSQYEAIKHITQDFSDVSSRFRSCFMKYI